MRQNTTPITPVNVKNLCSRKLWEILICDEDQILSPQQEQCIEAELLARQHYLPELNELRETVPCDL